MKRQFWGCAVLGGLLTMSSGPSSYAKPPDLPAYPDVACPEGREPAGPNGGGLPPVVDATGPCLMPMIVERVCQDVLRTWTGTSGELDVAETRARDLYETAERQRRAGKLDQARMHYQEAHLLSPTSRYGRRAMRRLSELERTALEGTEEQEAPQAVPPTEEPPLGDMSRRSQVPFERQYLKMRDRSQPLGLVERSY